MSTTLDRPLLREPDGECWDTGPETVYEPNYRALLAELMESVASLLDGSHDETHHGVHVSLGNLQDVRSDFDRISMELAGVNP